MDTRARLASPRSALRTWLRLACAVVTLAVIAAPAAFGASVDPVLRMLGDAQVHVCKCGMPAGKCGCPECDRAEKERLDEHRTEAAPTFKRHCDDEAPAMPLGAALSASVLSATSGATLPVPRGERLPIAVAPTSLSSMDAPPPTPPPRTATV